MKPVAGARALRAARRIPWIAAGVLWLAAAGTAAAHRPPTASEFRGIAATIGRYTSGFYCPRSPAVDVSTRDPRWAAAFAISNCGSGSLETRFYVRRPTRHAHAWQVVQVTSAHGIDARPGPACAGREVPPDIRCGVRGRS
jgi:hypothetical protein